MRIRLAGVGLIAIGVLFAVSFIYLPIRQGPAGFMGPVRLQSLVFVPLAMITGVALVVGGAPVLVAFQIGRRTRGQLALVLSIILGSAVVTGLGYWQLRTRWMPLRQGPEVIRDFKVEVPKVSQPEWNIPHRQ